jgi:hypothetical protein
MLDLLDRAKEPAYKKNPAPWQDLKNNFKRSKPNVTAISKSILPLA